MSQNKFNTNPPKLNQSDIDKLILGAEQNLIDSLPSKEMPWDSARTDVIKLMNVRMPEEYYIKLDYLSKKHRISKNKLCLEAVIAEIDRMLAK
jgi:hypothetical protein